MTRYPAAGAGRQDLGSSGSGRRPSIGAPVRTFDRAALRRHLDDAGLTIPELATRLRMGRPRVSEWVHGHHAPSPAKLVAAARLLGCQPWELTTARPDTAELYDLRVWTGRTLRELAAATGIPFGTLARLEAGHFVGAPARLERLAAELDTDPATVAAALDRSRNRYQRRRDEQRPR